MTPTVPGLRAPLVAAVDLGIGVFLYLYVAASLGVFLTAVGVLLLVGFAYEVSTNDSTISDRTPRRR